MTDLRVQVWCDEMSFCAWSDLFCDGWGFLRSDAPAMLEPGRCPEEKAPFRVVVRICLVEPCEDNTARIGDFFEVAEHLPTWGLTCAG